MFFPALSCLSFGISCLYACEYERAPTLSIYGTIALWACSVHIGKSTANNPAELVSLAHLSWTLFVLDFCTLSHAQLKKAKDIFNKFDDKYFLPAYIVHTDGTRNFSGQVNHSRIG